MDRYLQKFTDLICNRKKNERPVIAKNHTNYVENISNQMAPLHLD